MLSVSPHFGTCCAGGVSRVRGTSVVLLPNSGGALSSLRDLQTYNVTSTVVHTRGGKGGIVNVYKKCRVVKTHLRSPGTVRKGLPTIPKLNLLPRYAVVRPRGVAHRDAFTFLPKLYGSNSYGDNSQAVSCNYHNCRVRVKQAALLNSTPRGPITILGSKQASNCCLSGAY